METMPSGTEERFVTPLKKPEVRYVCVSNSNSTVCTSQKLTLETRFPVHAKML